jgi:hypothetical protein
MNNHFEIYPYERVNDMRFGMSPEEFYNIAGSPNSTRVTKYGTLIGAYEYFKVFFEEESTMAEIEFYDNADVFYNNINLFRDENSLTAILAISKNPLESGEALLFPELGFSMWGFHKEADGKTVCVSSQSAYDDIVKYYKPYSL